MVIHTLDIMVDRAVAYLLPMLQYPIISTYLEWSLVFAIISYVLYL